MSDDKLRVLVLSTRFPDKIRPNGGNFIERQTMELAARPGVEVEVVAPIGVVPFPLPLFWQARYRRFSVVPLEENWKGLRVSRPRYASLPYLWHLAPAAMGRRILPLLKTIRRRFPFDVISAEFFWPEGPAAAMAAGALGVPFSLKGRGHDVEEPAGLGRSRPALIAAAQAADGLLAISGAVRQTMIGLGLPEERIAIHYPGVDHDRFRPVDRQAAKASLGIDGPLLLSPGNLMERKGHMIVVEALARLPGVGLIIAGSGPEAGRLSQRIEELGLKGWARLAGMIPHGEMHRLFAAADVTVLASSVEGLANVRIESLACGTPVVTTAVGGAHEIIDRPAAGRIVRPDPAAVASAVRELLDNPASPAVVAETVAGFRWEANAEQLEAHLRAIVRRARR